NWNNGEEAVLGLRNEYNATATVIICPWGSKGVYGWGVQMTKPIFVPAIEIKAIDTCGAGDCFIAASIWSMTCGKSLQESLQFACLVAARKCSQKVLHYRGNLPEITATEFKEKFSNGFGDYSWIHFEGRNFDQIHEMMSFVKTSKAENELLMISVEFEKIRNFSWFEKLIEFADVIFMSKDFAKSKNWNNGEEAVLGLRNEYNATATMIICPWGSKGVYGLGVQMTKPIFVPAIEIKAMDTCGAGDCFIAASIWSMTCGKSLQESLQFACLVAAKKCSQKGLKNILLE
uniref:Carbohydrate kinase PfkB domain-containing protein n=1 Tax=Panagrolaimus sp. JU765 TaxID=591449 RepID=A0AC34Q6K2_9BILA